MRIAAASPAPARTGGSRRLVQFGGRADVVDMPMRQHDPVDTGHARQDLGTRSRRSSVDQRTESSSRHTYTCQPFTCSMVRLSVTVTLSIR